MSTPVPAQESPPPPEPRRSMAVAVALTVLFGPLGLAYVNPAGAVLMSVAAVAAGLFTVGIALFVVWPVCILWAIIATIHMEEPYTGEPM